MHPKMAKIYVGVDTHKETHTAVAINCFNEKLGEITFENRPSAFQEFLNKVNSSKDIFKTGGYLRIKGGKVKDYAHPAKPGGDCK